MSNAMSLSLNKRAATAINTEVNGDERLREIERLYRNRYAHFLRVALLIVGDRERAVGGRAAALTTVLLLDEDDSEQSLFFLLLVGAAAPRWR